MIKIVGWHLTPGPNDLCACGQPAEVVVEKDGVLFQSCRACLPSDIQDGVLGSFNEAVDQQNEKV